MTARQIIRRTLLAGFGLGLGLTVFVDLAALVVPIYDMQLYDRVLMSRNFDTLTMLSVACAVGLLFFGALEFLRSACFLAVADTVSRRLSGPALEAGIRRAAGGDRSAGPQLARDVNEIQSFLGSGAVAGPLDALCAPMFVAVLFMLHPAFGYLAVAGIAVLVLAGLAAEWLVRPVLLQAQEQRRGADRALSRSLAEAELTEGVGMLPAIARRWGARYADAVRALSRAANRAQSITGLSRTLRFVLQGSVMALGAVLVIRGDTTPGCLMGANLLLNKCLGPFDHLIENCRSWTLARDAWRRLSGLALPEPATAPACEAEAEPGLVVQTAELRTPSGKVLLDWVDLRIAPGTFAVVCGPNGGGKTSLLRMMAGVCPPSQGAVLLDGAPVCGGPEVGFLPQSVSLLDGSIAENVCRLRDDLGGAIAAARRAGVHELIGRMARGYDTALAGDGATLSGGMRQRIGLARAIYGSPRLLLLDEPDASLDGEGSQALIRAIRACCNEGAIAIVISHRPATIDEADRVIEVRNGRVTERAPPVRRPAVLERA